MKINASESAGSGQFLPELIHLLLSTRSVTDVLGELARLAVQGEAGAMSCGLTMQQDGEAFTVVSSDARAGRVDEVQYGQGDGPCLQALLSGTIVSVPNMALETRWGDFPAHAVAEGVLSSFSIPVTAGLKLLGAMNFYGAKVRAFDDSDVVARLASLAAQASAVLTVVVHQAEQAELTSQLQEALTSRSVIDQALGIIGAQNRCNATEAFAILQTASQHRNRKLRDIAADIVTAATGHPPERGPELA